MNNSCCNCSNYIHDFNKIKLNLYVKLLNRCYDKVCTQAQGKRNNFSCLCVSEIVRNGNSN